MLSSINISDDAAGELVWQNSRLRTGAVAIRYIHNEASLSKVYIHQNAWISAKLHDDTAEARAILVKASPAIPFHWSSSRFCISLLCMVVIGHRLLFLSIILLLSFCNSLLVLQLLNYKLLLLLSSFRATDLRFAATLLPFFIVEVAWAMPFDTVIMLHFQLASHQFVASRQVEEQSKQIQPLLDFPH